jgi:hypothetical protein
VYVCNESLLASCFAHGCCVVCKLDDRTLQIPTRTVATTTAMTMGANTTTRAWDMPITRPLLVVEVVVANKCPLWD